MEDSIKKLIEDMQTKAKELREMYGALQTLRKYGAEIELPDLQTLVTLNGDSCETQFSSVIRPDEFFGMSNTEAAEKYLRKIGHAVPLEDIYNALLSGGITFGASGRNSLNVQLTRATRKFAKITSGSVISFGLLEWYPGRRKRVTGHLTPIIEDENNITEEIIEEAIQQEKEKSE